ncbi:MAG: hypothetical protein PF489_11580 [Salinivirgaceae bacterium]|nr:hypothetical protein [Salinivirgaceae bacterium]
MKAEKLMAEDSAVHHTGMKPFIVSDTSALFAAIHSRKGAPKNWVERKLRYENLLMVEDPKYRLTADPIMHFELLKNKDFDKFFYRNTRGFYITGRIGSNVSFYTTLYENQVAYQPFIQEFIDENGVIPRGGNFKPYEAPLDKLYTNGYDYSQVEGVLSWNVLPQLNLQIGQGAHFVGEGYRSLLLSDNSYTYPYVKATFTRNRIQYSSMYAEMMDFDLPNSAESGFQKKRFSIQYLSLQLTRWLQVGVFESVVYKAEDSIGYRGFKPNYINPVLFSRAIEYNLNGKNNVLLGFNWNVTILPKLQYYGQLAWDEFGTEASGNHNSADNKTGVQFGVKWFDALTINNLYLQGEYNRVRPFTYGSIDAKHSFSHARQPLAHPLGANFHEIIGIGSYQLSDFMLETRLSIARAGTDTLSPAVSNLFIDQQEPEPGNAETVFLQGVQSTLIYSHVQLSYLLNPRTNLRIYAGAGYRRISNEMETRSDTFVFFGLRTFLANQTFDY